MVGQEGQVGEVDLAGPVVGEVLEGREEVEVLVALEVEEEDRAGPEGDGEIAHSNHRHFGDLTFLS